jgi:ATP-dependent RNA helicase DHX57
MTTLQDIFNLRREFCGVLEERGFLTPQCDPMDPTLNLHSDKSNLLKAIILGGLWPRVVRVHLPRGAIKFDKLQSGTIQRDNTAKEFKMYDLREGRVFIHPGSVLFHCASWRSPFLAYFHKYQSSKVFLSDATEVRLDFQQPKRPLTNFRCQCMRYCYSVAPYPSTMSKEDL